MPRDTGGRPGVKPAGGQGYRIWNFRAIGRGRRLGFRHLWSSLGRRDAFVRRKLGRRGSNAIPLGWTRHIPALPRSTWPGALTPLLVPGETTLGGLHRAIQAAMDEP